jgi:uncharacterized DUF497 family protein
MNKGGSAVYSDREIEVYSELFFETVRFAFANRLMHEPAQKNRYVRFNFIAIGLAEVVDFLARELQARKYDMSVEDVLTFWVDGECVRRNARANQYSPEAYYTGESGKWTGNFIVLHFYRKTANRIIKITQSNETIEPIDFIKVVLGKKRPSRTFELQFALQSQTESLMPPIVYDYSDFDFNFK